MIQRPCHQKLAWTETCWESIDQIAEGAWQKDLARICSLVAGQVREDEAVGHGHHKRDDLDAELVLVN